MAKMKVTKGIFDAVKTLTKGGASIDECAKYMGISSATVSRIRQAENFEEFQQARRLAAIAAKKREQEKKAREKQPEKPAENHDPVSKPAEQPAQPVPQVIEHRQTVTVQATHYMMEEMKKQTELLKLISNKLAFIVEQLA